VELQIKLVNCNRELKKDKEKRKIYRNDNSYWERITIFDVPLGEREDISQKETHALQGNKSTKFREGKEGFI